MHSDICSCRCVTAFESAGPAIIFLSIAIIVAACTSKPIFPLVSD